MSPRSSFDLDHLCPHCSQKLDKVRATGPDPQPPEQGDYGLCMTCGEFLIFDQTAIGGARKPSADEDRKLKQMPMHRRAKAFWDQLNRQRPRH